MPHTDIIHLDIFFMMEKLFSTACTSSSSKFCNIFWYTNYLIVFLNGFCTKLFDCISKWFFFHHSLEEDLEPTTPMVQLKEDMHTWIL